MFKIHTIVERLLLKSSLKFFIERSLHPLIISVLHRMILAPTYYFEPILTLRKAYQFGPLICKELDCHCDSHGPLSIPPNLYERKSSMSFNLLAIFVRCHPFVHSWDDLDKVTPCCIESFLMAKVEPWLIKKTSSSSLKGAYVML